MVDIGNACAHKEDKHTSQEIYNRRIRLLIKINSTHFPSSTKRFCQGCDTLFILGESIDTLHGGLLLSGDDVNKRLQAMIEIHPHGAVAKIPGLMICRGKFASFPIQSILWCSNIPSANQPEVVKYIEKSRVRTNIVIKAVPFISPV